MMAVYTALLGGVGAIASGVAVPVSHVDLPGGEAGWRFALLVIGLALLPFAIGSWAWATRGARAPAGTAGARGRTGIWSDPVAWTVAAYMGFQASTFYMLLTWLASISASTGRSAVVAGIDVMIYQIFSLVGSLVVPLVLRGGAERWVPALIPTLGIIGVIGLMAAPDAIIAWVVLIGLSSGASLGMTLTLMAQRIPTGIVHINDQTVNDEANSPFGGTGASGTGSRHGGAQANIDAFTETRWITLRREPGQYPL
jgi:CP family cyanate transporter-like MFS transporter